MLAQTLSFSLSPTNGFKVVSISNTAKSFLEIANSIGIDIAIIDINLPDLDGAELCSIIKRDFPKIKVIGFSLHESVLFFNDMISNGAKGYVLKNDGLEELKIAINAVHNNLTYYSQGILNLLVNKPLKCKVEIKLSNRQEEIINLIVKGATTKQIAAKLYLSEATVATHRNAIMKKLNVHNVAGIINFANNQNNIN